MSAPLTLTLRHVLLALLLALHALAAHAHKASDSYLTLRVTGADLDGRLDVAVRDLDFVLGVDADADGNVTWGELSARSNDIARYALARLQVARAGAPCTATPATSGELMIDTHSDGAYAVLPLRFHCARAHGALRLSYRLLFDIDPTHRGLASISDGPRTTAMLFAPASAVQTLAPAVQSWRDTLGEYLVAGIHHIWSGADHILFVVSLLLAVGRQAAVAADAARATPYRQFVELCKLVTAFSLAHSTTLALGYFDLVHFPERWVESGIALSIVIASLNNIVRFVPFRDWVMACAFGLVHGLGFANTLADMALTSTQRVLALAAFNGGVELGQLCIVAPLFLLALWLRGRRFYRPFAVPAISVAIALAGLVWLFERAFDLGFTLA